MTGPGGALAKDRVHVTDDFRDNLIIDRYDPIFVGMRASKRKHLRSENSEDAVTWNVFRSLRQIEPASWLPTLCKVAADSRIGVLPPDDVSVNLWAPASPPTSLLAFGDEGISEIDVIIEAPTWVWFIEAKYGSDISTGTTKYRVYMTRKTQKLGGRKRLRIDEVIGQIQPLAQAEAQLL